MRFIQVTPTTTKKPTLINIEEINEISVVENKDKEKKVVLVKWLSPQMHFNVMIEESFEFISKKIAAIS